MLNYKFDWDPLLELDIPILDKHHQHFFKIGRHIEQLILTQCANVTEDQLFHLLYELRDYVTYHFYIEEEIMKKIDFPEIKRHHKEHQSFLTYINTIDYDKLCANPLAELTQLRTDMITWSFTHILQEDKKLTIYYQATQILESNKK